PSGSVGSQRRPGPPVAAAVMCHAGAMDSAHVDDVPTRYAEFARYEVRGRTPVYLAWARGIADDPGTCALIERLPRIKRQPALVFAAARHAGAAETEDYTDFRDFLHA